MTITSWDELDDYGLSGRLWRKFAVDGMLVYKDRRWGIGFRDDFLGNFQASTLEGPYLILATQGDIELVASTGNTATTALGQVKLPLVGDAGNDEIVLQWGRGLDAPFKLADRDLCFEARLCVSAITAAKWSWAAGLGEVGMGATDCLFADTTGALADKNFCGFVHLQAEGASVDGAYKADGQTYQDGATKTKLNALHTAVADTFVKLGFRYFAHPKKLEFYVNGVRAGTDAAPARLTTAELDAATFPDDVFLAPIIGAKDIAGNAALNMHLDWWACAQAIA